MSLDQWDRPRRTTFCHITPSGFGAQPNTCFRSAGGRVLGIASNPGGVGFGAWLINDPEDLTSGTFTQLGSPTITQADGTVIPWYNVQPWDGGVWIEERDEFWMFHVSSFSSSPVPVGFTRIAFWALIIDGGSMTATTSQCGFATGDFDNDPPAPVGFGRYGYDPSTNLIYLVHNDADFDQSPTKSTYTVNTINPSTRVINLGAPQTMFDLSGAPIFPGGDLIPTGGYMMNVTSGFTTDPRVLLVNTSTRVCENHSVGFANSSWGRGVSFGGKAYFPPNNGAGGLWLIGNGPVWTLTDGGDPFSSAAGCSQAHVGPGNKIYGFPYGGSGFIAIFDPATNTQTTKWPEDAFSGQSGTDNRSAILPNGNMIAPRGGADEWILTGLREYPESHGIPAQREPLVQFGPHVGAVAQPPQPLDEPFVLWVTSHWDGGHWIVNEGTGGAGWDCPVFIEAWNSTPESHRMWAGWRHFIPVLFDIEDDFGGPVGGPNAKPITMITAYGDYDPHYEFVYTYSDVGVRTTGGNATEWQMSRNEMQWDESPSGSVAFGPNGFVSYFTRGGGTYLELDVDDWGNPLPDEPNLRGRLLVITHDIHLGGMSVFIDGVSFPLNPTSTVADDYVFPQGDSNLDSVDRYANEVSADRSFFTNLTAWNDMWCQWGQNSTNGGPPIPGEPWSGVNLIAFARGEPTKEDMAHYYQLAYPGNPLPPDLQ